MRQIIAVLVLLSCGQARGSLIYISESATATASSVIAQPVPVVVSRTNSFPTSPLFTASATQQPSGNHSGASAGANGGAVLTPNDLTVSANIGGQATGDSPALYGVASASGSQTFQFSFTTTQPATFFADISAVALASGAAGDDVANASFSLSGGGMSITQSVPTSGGSEIEYSAPINPVLGAVYTLSLSGSISTDGIAPLRNTFPLLVSPAQAKWDVEIQQTPEPSTLVLALVGLALVALLSLLG